MRYERSHVNFGKSHWPLIRGQNTRDREAGEFLGGNS